MKFRNILLSLLVSATGLLYSQTYQWTATSSGTPTYNEGTSIIADDNGNTYITGYFSNTITFGSLSLVAADLDIFIAKFDSNGNCLWLKKAGGSQEDKGKSISIDALGNCYITGYFTGIANFGSITLTGYGGKDIFVTKYDASGTVQWAKNAGAVSDDEGSGISTGLNGDSYVTGYFQGTANFSGTSLTNNGAKDIFIAKYDNSGILVSVSPIGGTSNEEGTSIAFYNNDVYLTGNFYSASLPVGGTTLTNSGAPTSAKVIITKYTSGLIPVWATRSSGNNTATGYSIAADNNYVYVTGNYSSGSIILGATTLSLNGLLTTSDIFVTKLNNNTGTFVWAVKGGGSQVDRANCITASNSGNIFVTGIYGEFSGAGSFGSCTLPATVNGGNTFIWKLDQTGSCLWISQSNNNTGLSRGNAITTKNCDTYFTGTYAGTSTFGTMPPISSPSPAQNVYYGKLSDSHIPLSINITSSNSFCSGSDITVTGSVLTGVANNYWWELIECDQQGNIIQNGFNWQNGWLPGTPGSFTIPSNVNPPCGKYYIVKLAVGNYCEPWVSTTKIIKINCTPTAVAGNDISICAGSCTNLSTIPTQGVTYTWLTTVNNTEAVVGTGASISVCPESTTTYTLKASTKAGCFSTDPITVNTVNNNPNFSTTTAHTNGTNYFTVSAIAVDQTANTQPGFTYQWNVLEISPNTSNTGGTQICWWHNVTSPQTFPGYNGSTTVDCIALPVEGHFPTFHTYRIIRTTWNSYCPAKKDSVTVTNSGSRIGNFNTNEPVVKMEDRSVLMIHPNPSNGLLNIKVENAIDRSYKIEVFDMFGKLIYKDETINTGSEFNTQIDLTNLNLAHGVYLIKVNSDNQRTSQRIVIEK